MTGPCLKICGVTSAEDARLVSASGADYCGILVGVGFSERSLSLPQAGQVAAASAIPVVILLCDPDVAEAEEVVRQIHPHAVQLLCHESPEFLRELKSRLPCRVWKTVHLPAVAGQASAQEYAQAGADALLVDRVETSEGFARLGGTGKVVDWQAAKAIVNAVSIPVFLAGGLNPGNIDEAVTEVRPYGVDLCSGVEASTGRKDPEKLRLLVSNFKAAIARIQKGQA